MVLKDGVADSDGSGRHCRGHVDWVQDGTRHLERSSGQDRFQLSGKHLLVQNLSVGMGLQEAVPFQAFCVGLETRRGVELASAVAQTLFLQTVKSVHVQLWAMLT